MASHLVPASAQACVGVTNPISAVPPSRLYLVHWKEREVAERIRRLEAAGFAAEGGPGQGPVTLKALEADPPDAVVIDLTRLPSQGRDMAIALRTRAGTRAIPLVFLDGDPAKVVKIQALLPDATYAAWEDAGPAITHAVETATDDVVVPDSVFAAYAGKPLAQKLGVKPGMRLAAVHAPEGFDEALGKLPEGAHLVATPDEDAGLTIWFVKDQGELEADLAGITTASKRAPVWVAWPKRASKLESDLSQVVVRKACMDAGMVDYKICAVDSDWSALLFTWRGA